MLFKLHSNLKNTCFILRINSAVTAAWLISVGSGVIVLMFLNRLLAEAYRLNLNTSIKRVHMLSGFVSDLFGFRELMRLNGV